MGGYLLVLGNRDAVGWVLHEQRTAFLAQHGAVRHLKPGDDLILYTTRGCWKNPTRDRGRVIGTATVSTPIAPLPDAPTFGQRTYPVGCDLNIPVLAPFGQGPILADLVTALESLNHGRGGWGTMLRRPLVPLSEADHTRLRSALAPLERPRPDAIEPYLRWWRSATTAATPTAEET